MKRERIEIGRPVFLLRLDDVEVREEEDRLAAGAGAAAIADDEIALARIRTADEDVRRREPGGAEPRGHRLGRRGRVCRRCRWC